MKTKPEPKKPDLKKDLEAALGDKIAVDVQRLNLWSPVGSFFFANDGKTTWQNLIVAFPKQCYDTPLLEASGSARTGSDGKITFRLSYFVCFGSGSGYSLAAPVNVVATPQTPDPVFLTAEHTLVDNATDVEIKVSTWDANGAAAPDIFFDFRCRVVYSVVVL